MIDPAPVGGNDDVVVTIVDDHVIAMDVATVVKLAVIVDVTVLDLVAIHMTILNMQLTVARVNRTGRLVPRPHVAPALLELDRLPVDLARRGMLAHRLGLDRFVLHRPVLWDPVLRRPLLEPALRRRHLLPAHGHQQDEQQRGQNMYSFHGVSLVRSCPKV